MRAPAGGGLVPNPLATSDAGVSAGEVWGAIIGANVGAAEACGVAPDRLSRYLERVDAQLESLRLAADDRERYAQALADARKKSAALSRDADECSTIAQAL